MKEADRQNPDHNFFPRGLPEPASRATLLCALATRPFLGLAKPIPASTLCPPAPSQLSLHKADASPRAQGSRDPLPQKGLPQRRQHGGPVPPHTPALLQVAPSAPHLQSMGELTEGPSSSLGQSSRHPPVPGLFSSGSLGYRVTHCATARQSAAERAGGRLLHSPQAAARLYSTSPRSATWQGGTGEKQ